MVKILPGLSLKLSVCLLVLSVLANAALHSDQNGDLRQRAQLAFHQGRMQDAEEAARLLMKAAPEDPDAIGFLAVILDAEQRYEEAEPFFQQALRQGTPSIALLRNLGGHYLLTSHPELARAAFQKVLLRVASDLQANMQLAHLAIQGRNGRVALRYLNAIPASDAGLIKVEILRAEALRLAGRNKDATSLIQKLYVEVKDDPQGESALGLLLARMGDFAQAEAVFAHVLEAWPSDFSTLYNLGLTEANVGNLDRAATVFESALKQRADDSECLFNLGQVYSRQKHYRRASDLLTRAAVVAPARADIQLALAQALEHAGYAGDAALVYDRYLELKPGDDIGRRDRALVYASANQEKKAQSELEWFTSQHGEDSLGHYYLALLLQNDDPVRATTEVDRALRLQPGLAGASLLRSQLLLNADHAELAAEEAERGLRSHPGDADLWKQLGACRLGLDQAKDAEAALRRALALSPGNDSVLWLLSRALNALGRKQEAREASAMFEKARAERSRRPEVQADAGALELLRLPEAERQRQQWDWVRGTLALHPTDPEVLVEYGKLSLATGHPDDARGAFARLLDAKPTTRISEEAGKILGENGEFGQSLEFFRLAVSADPAAHVGMALAQQGLGMPQQALVELDQVPESARKPEYHLVRAIVFDTLGQHDDAVHELNDGFTGDAVRPELAFAAARMLVLSGQKPSALALLQRSTTQSDEINLALAWLLEDQGRVLEARSLVRRVQSKRPEWGRTYILQSHWSEKENQTEAATRELETAYALGEKGALVCRSLSRLYTAVNRTTEAKQYAVRAEVLAQNHTKLDDSDSLTDLLFSPSR